MNEKGEIMSKHTPQQPTTSLLEVVASFLFGGAVLTMALFPLAVPMVALLIVVALPLVALGAGVAAIVAALTVPVMLIRGLSRKLATMSRDRREGQLIRGNKPMMGAHG
jgi:hypothetical protein